MCHCVAMDCVHKLVLRIIAKKEQRAAAIANGADPATMPIRRYVPIFRCKVFFFGGGGYRPGLFNIVDFMGKQIGG